MDDGFAISLCFVIKERSRQHYDGRLLELFPRCIDSLVASGTLQDQIEVVVADYGSTDWPLMDWLPQRLGRVPVTIVTMEGDFSRGRGLNYAAAHARQDILFFLDVDMLLTRELLKLAFEQAQAGKVFAPVSQDLDQAGRIRGERLDGYGSVAVGKELFERAGRWPEFLSWGGEDTILFETLQTLAPILRRKVDHFFHQWHPEGDWRERFYLRSASTDYFNYKRQ